DDRALGLLALAVPGAGPLALARPAERVDVPDGDVEDLLHGDLDLRLVRVRPHQERVLVLIQQPVALLRDHRSKQDVPRVAAHEPSSLCSSVAFATAAVLIGWLASSLTVPSPSSSAASGASSAAALSVAAWSVAA